MTSYKSFCFVFVFNKMTYVLRYLCKISLVRYVCLFAAMLCIWHHIKRSVSKLLLSSHNCIKKRSSISHSGSFRMFSEVETRPECGPRSDRRGKAWPTLRPLPGSQWRAAVQRWPCCHAAPQMEANEPESQWYLALGTHTATSQSHYLTPRPGGLIQG